METMKAMKQLKYGTLVSNSSFGGTMRRSYLHPAAVLWYAVAKLWVSPKEIKLSRSISHSGEPTL